MVVELTTWALAEWVGQRNGQTYASPVGAWQLGREPETKFPGFDNRRPAGEFGGLINPSNLEHVKLAEQLRVRLAEEREPH